MNTKEEKETARLAEIGAMTDEQLAASVIDSIQAGTGMRGILRILTAWCRDVRAAEALKASRGSAIANRLEDPT